MERVKYGLQVTYVITNDIKSLFSVRNLPYRIKNIKPVKLLII